jgi:glycosyltransferase involved in cell wall biosynthesis
MKPIDIFITAYLRPKYTLETIRYLKERTKYPYRLFLIDQGETNLTAKDMVDFYIGLDKNIGIHAAWNLALSLAESEYFITTDNDIYVPELEGQAFIDSPDTNIYRDWLERMVNFMDERPDYAAISLHPHVFIGAAGIDPKDPEDVKERNMCGAVMRIMRTEFVRKAGGWEHKIEAGRNHEERTICSRLQSIGYKVGITSRIRAYHPFGKDLGGNWGYSKEFTPEMQKHNPDLEQYVQQFDNMDSYDNKTWLPK